MRKPFSDFLWIWLKKIAGVVWKTLTSFSKAHFYVSRRTFWGSFSRRHHHVSVTLGIWITSVGLLWLLRRLSKVHPRSFPWQVDLFEDSFFWNFWCFFRSLFDFHRTVSAFNSTEFQQTTFHMSWGSFSHKINFWSVFLFRILTENNSVFRP